jgi:tetratricopeptide (TPR) repeat protein
VPAHNYRDRLTISKIKLVSMILNNRIAEHERQNRYADSVPVAIDRAALLLGAAYSSATEVDASEALFEDPGKVVIDRLFNYGASLLRANREEDGILWAEAASARYADTERWQDFVMAAVNNRITRFLRERDVNTEAARTFLEGKKSILTAGNYAQLDTILIDAELLKRANHIRGVEDGDFVISGALNARENGRLPERRANELIVYSVQKTAAILCAAPARDWRAAINYIEAFTARFGERLGASRELEQTLRTYKGNLATDYHNRFAAEWNRKNYDEAERILNEGLSEFPGNRQLLTDRETVNRRR